MRKRALSNEGLQLYLNSITPKLPTKKIFCQLFHSIYDDRLDSIVRKCRQSTLGLCNQFDDPQLRERLDAGILHTIRLILTRDKKTMKKKHAGRHYRFFLDVMKRAFQEEDHQTASMIAIALNDPAITNLKIKTPKYAGKYIKKVLDTHGWANCNKHVKTLLKNNSKEVLPSLITFAIYIKRQQCIGQPSKAINAKNFLELYKDLSESVECILPIYHQKRISRKELTILSKQIIS